MTDAIHRGVGTFWSPLFLAAVLILFNCDPRAAEGQAQPDLGPNASLRGARVFPADDPWNMDVSQAPVDADSVKLIAGIGANRPLHADFGTVWDGVPCGIPYYIVSGRQPKVTIDLKIHRGESDPGPYPIPADAPIEGGPTSTGDRHVLVIDRDNWVLYELFRAFPQPGGVWAADGGAVFDLKRNTLRPAGFTSADAAGLPIFPGLARYDEVMEQKAINHALRFTVEKTRRAYIPPARHFASRATDPALPPMGLRVRLRANYDISSFPPPVQVILVALKKHGMILADNGGNWFISGAPDPRWNDEQLGTLRLVKGRDLEVIQMAGMVKDR